MSGNVKTMKDLRECVEGALQILLALFAIALLALAPVYATRAASWTGSRLLRR